MMETIREMNSNFQKVRQIRRGRFQKMTEEMHFLLITVQIMYVLYTLCCRNRWWDLKAILRKAKVEEWWLQLQAPHFEWHVGCIIWCLSECEFH